MKTTLTLAALLTGMALPCSAQTTTAPPAEPGVVDTIKTTATRLEGAVQRGAKAAASGVERGAQAAARGVKTGVHAAAQGIEKGAKATARAAEAVADKVKP